jgi:hypothetical protein
MYKKKTRRPTKVQQIKCITSLLYRKTTAAMVCFLSEIPNGNQTFAASNAANTIQ